ncbi:MAG: RsmD family RNA methyltransferase [Bacteroidota bacterium]|nr:RsmD family RNA methyltransferase [Bacteroidota bacterium]
MRIISGNNKGRKIKVLKDFKDHPTTDFAKESLFNILNNLYYFEDIRVLDLFTGSGNISFEFASHGTSDITLVDSNSRYVRFIEQQTEGIFPEVDFNCIIADAFDFVKNTPLNYDIIFADPPYSMENVDKLPDLVFANEHISDDLLFILEHSKKQNFKNHHFFIKERKYGNVHFSMFSNEKK